MAINRVKTLNSATIHFAVVDIKDDQGNVIIPKGAFKNVQLEHVEYLEEDGVMLEGTRKRIASSERDLDNAPDIKNALAASVVRAIAQKQDVETQLAVVTARAEKAEAMKTALQAQVAVEKSM